MKMSRYLAICWIKPKDFSQNNAFSRYSRPWKKYEQFRALLSTSRPVRTLHKDTLGLLLVYIPEISQERCKI